MEIWDHNASFDEAFEMEIWDHNANFGEAFNIEPERLPMTNHNKGLKYSEPMRICLNCAWSTSSGGKRVWPRRSWFSLACYWCESGVWRDFSRTHHRAWWSNANAVLRHFRQSVGNFSNLKCLFWFDKWNQPSTFLTEPPPRDFGYQVYVSLEQSQDTSLPISPLITEPCYSMLGLDARWVYGS